MDNYEFKLILDDSGDELSEQFNAKDAHDIMSLEHDIKDIIESNSPWTIKSIKLVKVTTEF